MISYYFTSDLYHFYLFLICIDFTAQYKINGVMSLPDVMSFDKVILKTPIYHINNTLRMLKIIYFPENLKYPPLLYN